MLTEDSIKEIGDVLKGEKPFSAIENILNEIEKTDAIRLFANIMINASMEDKKFQDSGFQIIEHLATDSKRFFVDSKDVFSGYSSFTDHDVDLDAMKKISDNIKNAKTIPDTFKHLVQDIVATENICSRLGNSNEQDRDNVLKDTLKEISSTIVNKDSAIKSVAMPYIELALKGSDDQGTKNVIGF